MLEIEISSELPKAALLHFQTALLGSFSLSRAEIDIVLCKYTTRQLRAFFHMKNLKRVKSSDYNQSSLFL